MADAGNNGTAFRSPRAQSGGSPNNVIELLSDDEVNDKPPALPPQRPKRKKFVKAAVADASRKSLQGGLVLEEDIDHLVTSRRTVSDDSDEDSSKVTLGSYVQQQDQLKAVGGNVVLYHDPDFESTPASIEGHSRSKKVEKCRCSPALPVALSYKSKGPNKGRPYHHCPKTSNQCRYFRWAFQAERMHWYRFGPHTGHVIVRDGGFSANDLVQGKVGDCWFLSALAVIAERPDLIMRLFMGNDASALNNPYGIVQVNLFLDGYWKTIVMDNFLPCIIDSEAENELQQAMQASLAHAPMFASSSASTLSNQQSSSKYDPHALSDKNRQVLAETQSFLEEDRKRPVNPYAKKPPCNFKTNASRNNSSMISSTSVPNKLGRLVTTEDLAYSKARKQQLWVPFLEKAYAKSHGCYQAISGGHVAEAFLDLTGAPTLVYNLHNDPSFDPRSFWYKLLTYRKQRLPMGCGTSSSAAGIIGMHAYSILDVREIRNVGVEFFREKLADRSLGNVSGFTDFDGTVRLLRIRNPHGQGEWKGEFSDKSAIWEKLLQHTGRSESMNSPGLSSLERTMKNDGTFWIDYDSFLMGFSNVDVVLAFMGNHAKSFASNFPEKKSNNRCTRAFEVSLLDIQPGVPSRDTVELYVMGIQKTRRGSYHGRADRKVSYKICDLGILVGKNDGGRMDGEGTTNEEIEFDSVEGQMFGFRRNGHYRLILNRKKSKSLVVMPVSFGHPAATDKEKSFVLRFVADAPLLIREIPTVPRMDKVLQKFCFEPDPYSAGIRQRKKRVLLEDTDGIQMYGEPLYRVFQVDCLANGGGVVFVYFCVNDMLMQKKGISQRDFRLDLSIEATCRGMTCRLDNGFLAHETLAKGKKFEAAWRKFEANFSAESKTRLLMVLVQSGQDSEMGTVICRKQETRKSAPGEGLKQTNITLSGSLASGDGSLTAADGYARLGVFNGIDSAFPEKHRAARFGRSEVSGIMSDALRLDLVDDDLERALALSRGDTEMREAIDLSKEETASSEEKQMALALQNSMAETNAVDQSLQEAISASSKVARKSVEASSITFDNDIEEAIRRSLREKTAVATGGGGFFDVDTSTQNDAHLKPPATKRRKNDPDVIELMDDEDDGEGKGDIATTAAQTSNQAPELEEKRRLAAEAAEMRFARLYPNPK